MLSHSSLYVIILYKYMCVWIVLGTFQNHPVAIALYKTVSSRKHLMVYEVIDRSCLFLPERRFMPFMLKDKNIHCWLAVPFHDSWSQDLLIGYHQDSILVLKPSLLSSIFLTS